MSQQTAIADKFSQVINNLQGDVLIKDLNHRYINASEKITRFLGFDDPKDILNTTDFDHPCPTSNRADSYVEEDNRVIATGQSVFKLDQFHFANDYFYTCFYEKWLLLDKNQKPAAIVTHNRQLGEEDLSELNSSIYKILIHQAFGNANMRRKMKTNNVYNLSKRQIECLNYSLYGETAASISAHLGLSKRTVESYLNEIKTKMGCKSKKEMIAKAMRCGYWLV